MSNLLKVINYITSLPDDNSNLVPPDPISNSEVKRICANGSAGLPCVRVGHRQAFYLKPLSGFEPRVPSEPWGFFIYISRFLAEINDNAFINKENYDYWTYRRYWIRQNNCWEIFSGPWS